LALSGIFFDFVLVHPPADFYTFSAVELFKF